MPSKDDSQTPRREGVRYEETIPISEKNLGIVASGLSRGEIPIDRTVLVIENGNVVSVREWWGSRNQ